MRQLVRDEPQPFARGRRRALVLQQELAALADAHGELAELGGAHGRQPPVRHQALLEDRARRVDVDHDVVGHRQRELAREQ